RVAGRRVGRLARGPALAAVGVALALARAGRVRLGVALGGALEARRVDLALGDAARDVAGRAAARRRLHVALAPALDLELARARGLDRDGLTARRAAALDLH